MKRQRAHIRVLDYRRYEIKKLGPNSKGEINMHEIPQSLPNVHKQSKDPTTEFGS